MLEHVNEIVSVIASYNHEKNRFIPYKMRWRLRDYFIKRLAYHDALTGLPNRALLEDRLSVALAQARRSEESVRGQLSTAEAAEFSRLLDKLLAGLRSQRGNGRA